MAENITAESVTSSFSQTDTAILDALVPGYSLLSKFVSSHLNIDVASYLQYVILLATFGASFQYLIWYMKDMVEMYFMSTAEIRFDDETFNFFMYWMSRQVNMSKTNRFVAGVKTSGYWSDDCSDDEDDEKDIELDEPGSGENESSFEEYWAKLTGRDKYRTLRYTPSEGRHFFRFRGKLLMLERKQQQQTPLWVMNNETLYLSCLGRNPGIIKDLLNEAQQTYVERDGNRTVIYRGQRLCSGQQFGWYRCMARCPRPLSTVVLEQAQKDEFISDIKEYLHPRTRRWYSNRGIPYRRGYLLHGPPGTGKTSLCFAAAGLLSLKLYLLNLDSKALDEDNLASLFHDLPRRCIVLLEDVDTAGGGTTDSPKDKDKPTDGTDPTAVDETEAKDKDKDKKEEKSRGITLSALLNVIDGVAASEGRILVMTTNHPEKLDAALLRPGRVDLSITFGRTTQADIEELFTSIYTTMEGDLPRAAASRRLLNGTAKHLTNGSANHKHENGNVEYAEKRKQENNEEEKRRLRDLRLRISKLATDFSAIVPNGEFTAAEIQGYLLNHKDSPEAAISGADTWVQGLREKKSSQQSILA
ncbi:ATPase AAA-type core [Penicillium manginii]|uniref:ATPase AAA-type core n=1 Tax=Penicillium manginii TaxID=203109 RepID=UPI0025478538|nr:ATPase AAA-type core [Penicillium manginii]KAJ5762883.1 ATPase AAA-type core [Penicillium manginii]